VKALIKYSVICASLINIAIANEEAAHHEPSIFDLKYPILNFIVLFGFLAWKLKKPVSEMFNKKSDDIKSLMNSAEKQSKDAHEKLQAFNAKMKNIESEVVQISSDYENDAVSFAKNLHEETETSIARMKRDLRGKLEGEKKEMLDDLNHEVVSKVIANAKNEIGKNPEHRKSATQKIITELR
jgi:F-type H+-transporting ATPase subunit b